MAFTLYLSRELRKIFAATLLKENGRIMAQVEAFRPLSQGARRELRQELRSIVGSPWKPVELEIDGFIQFQSTPLQQALFDDENPILNYSDLTIVQGNVT